MGEDDDLSIGQVTGDELQESLRLLLHGHPHGPALIRGLLEDAGGTMTPFHGLLAARRGQSVVGAVWTQFQAGRVATVWPPQVRPEISPSILRRLLTAAVQHARSQAVRLVQVLLERDGTPVFELFHSQRFAHTADLLYLVSLRRDFPQSLPDDGLEFEAYTSSEQNRLLEIIETSYVDTKDCPNLNGVRDGADVLDSYLATGQSGSSHWYILRHAGRDVGCLLLADHPAESLWELVYLGLLPEARGHGWGLAATRLGQWLAGQSGAARMMLAVDAGNAPALRVYSAAGFTAWDRRTVLVRVLD